MKKIVSLILVLVLTIGVAPFSAKADTPNYIYDYENFEYEVGNRYADFDFYFGKGGVPTARLNLNTNSMTKNKTYYVYANYENAKGKEVNEILNSFYYTGQDYYDLPLGYGVYYKLGINNVKYDSEVSIKNYFHDLYGAVTKLDIPTVKEVGNKLCDSVSQLGISSPTLDRIDVYCRCNSTHAIYVDNKHIGNYKATGYDSLLHAITKVNGKKLVPGSKHTIKILPYATVNGINFLGEAVTRTVTVAPLTAPGKPSVTKLNKKMVSVYFNVPMTQQKKGLTTFYIYAGKKKVKTVKNKGKRFYLVTVKKKGIAKKKIKIVTKYGNKKKTSKAAKAKKNVRKWNYLKSVNAYSSYRAYFRPSKIYYSGKKLMLKGFYINAHVLKLKRFKIKLYVYVGGKKVAKKKLKVKMRPNCIKNIKIKLKKGKYYDLRNCYVDFNYDVLADEV